MVIQTIGLQIAARDLNLLEMREGEQEGIPTTHASAPRETWWTRQQRRLLAALGRRPQQSIGQPSATLTAPLGSQGS